MNQHGDVVGGGDYAGVAMPDALSATAGATRPASFASKIGAVFASILKIWEWGWSQWSLSVGLATLFFGVLVVRTELLFIRTTEFFFAGEGW